MPLKKTVTKYNSNSKSTKNKRRNNKSNGTIRNKNKNRNNKGKKTTRRKKSITLKKNNNKSRNNRRKTKTNMVGGTENGNGTANGNGKANGISNGNGNGNSNGNNNSNEKLKEIKKQFVEDLESLQELSNELTAENKTQIKEILGKYVLNEDEETEGANVVANNNSITEQEQYREYITYILLDDDEGELEKQIRSTYEKLLELDLEELKVSVLRDMLINFDCKHILILLTKLEEIKKILLSDNNEEEGNQEVQNYNHIKKLKKNMEVETDKIPYLKAEPILKKQLLIVYFLSSDKFTKIIDTISRKLEQFTNGIYKEDIKAILEKLLKAEKEMEEEAGNTEKESNNELDLFREYLKKAKSINENLQVRNIIKHLYKKATANNEAVQDEESKNNYIQSKKETTYDLNLEKIENIINNLNELLGLPSNEKQTGSGYNEESFELIGGSTERVLLNINMVVNDIIDVVCSINETKNGDIYGKIESDDLFFKVGFTKTGIQFNASSKKKKRRNKRKSTGWRK
jgi:hypothetical protein